MTRPIRVLHFADVHIGMENYGRLDPVTGTSSRVRDFLDRMDETIDFALREQADLAVFAGDAFKHRDPEPTQQREFAQRVKRLSDHMPVLLLQGNHDMAGQAMRASSVDIFQALQVPGVIVGSKPEGRRVETRAGPVFLAWMPYPMRNRLLSDPAHQGKSIGELDSALRSAVADILRDLAQQAAAHDMPRLLAAHLSAEEARVGSERLVMLGKDVALSTSVLGDPVWDYVALGHIHRHQELRHGRGPAVVYSGSLERIDFGEEEEQKGFCWVQLSRGGTTWEFVPVSARPFRTIRVDARRAEDPTAAVLAAVAKSDVRGAVVRVLIQIRAGQAAAVRDRDILPALSEAAHVGLYREVEDEARARLRHDSPESLTPIELLEEYFLLRQEPEERRRALLDLAGEILAAEAEASSAEGETE